MIRSGADGLASSLKQDVLFVLNRPGNTPATPLRLPVAMGGDDHLLCSSPYARLPLRDNEYYRRLLPICVYKTEYRGYLERHRVLSRRRCDPRANTGREDKQRACRYGAREWRFITPIPLQRIAKLHAFLRLDLHFMVLLFCMEAFQLRRPKKSLIVAPKSHFRGRLGGRACPLHVGRRWYRARGPGCAGISFDDISKCPITNKRAAPAVHLEIAAYRGRVLVKIT
ncbi:hypothetical protein EVAR_89742_1 [Eumeta japonica]|uniref:Uncharacterized protein n=1 Tax=Eumeta variegata TaxID=151549 RepID=A0A4C1Y791_EUMVA|nr:hypothetical protein EVAR_89742_1 [Eumeta japonica]